MEVSDLNPAVDYVFTIGHSNRPFDRFLVDLESYGIEVVADARSQPASKHVPQFNRNELRWRLEEDGIRYLFVGDQLGGRPPGHEFYDADGFVRYDLWSESQIFQAGVAELESTARQRRLAILCSEENPAECHRHLLIARVLTIRGWPAAQIVHIRSDGSALADCEIPIQREFFGDTVSWRSPQSVLHKVQRKTSSGGSNRQESSDSWMSA